MKLFHELEETKGLVLKMAGLAEEIIKGDDQIDQLEAEIERRCIRMIALYQPEAVDLRLIIGMKALKKGF